MSRPSSAQIECPIGLFEPCEQEIERLTAALNRASAREKEHLAHALLEEVSKLLACEAYDAANPNCQFCREVSVLRQKTAGLIEKATALGR